MNCCVSSTGILASSGRGARQSSTNSGSLTARSLTRINGYLAGLDLIEPGVAPVRAWRSDWEEDAVVDLSVPGLLGAVGRVP